LAICRLRIIIINIYAKKVAREHRIPFELSLDPFYSESNLKRLPAAITDAEAGKGLITKTMAELRAMENE
jgi:DNA-damage-inducible protein J